MNTNQTSNHKLSTPVYKHLNGVESWDSADKDTRIAFYGAMKGRAYGREPTLDAWNWFLIGRTGRPAVETKARRSTEGLIFDGADDIRRSVTPVLGTDKAISDEDLKFLIRMETESKHHRAFVELWERRGSPLEPEETRRMRFADGVLNEIDRLTRLNAENGEAPHE